MSNSVSSGFVLALWPSLIAVVHFSFFTVSTDMNLLAVLTYAVENLKVQHILVTGHYDCGGIRAAVKKQCYGQVLDSWLQVSVKALLGVFLSRLPARV